MRTPRGEAWTFFHETVLYHDSDECLIWPFPVSMGYPQLRGIHVHRRVCEEVHGKPLKPDLVAAHGCGKGHQGCVSPRHISWKTQHENVLDKAKHGTWQFGEAIGNSKLREDQVRTIRRLRETHTVEALSREFSVASSTIKRICSRQIWARLD